MSLYLIWEWKYKLHVNKVILKSTNVEIYFLSIDMNEIILDLDKDIMIWAYQYDMTTRPVGECMS
jgi:hypothetical protein